MKKTNKNYLFIGVGIISFIGIITLAILIITHIYSFVQLEKEYLQKKIVVLFKESVNDDLKNRSQILTEEISIGNSFTSNKDSSIFKSSTIEIKTTAQPNLSLNEKMTDFIQSILAIKNPINIYHLDTIFQQKLQSENIQITTAICLTDTINNKDNSCTHSNIDSFTPLFTTSYQISSIGISLQIYIKISLFSLIRRMPILYWVALLGWIIFTLSIGYIWYNLKRNIPVLIKYSVEREHALQKELTQKKQELETFALREKQKNNPDIHIFSPYLIFEKDTKTLRYYDEIIKLTRQQQQLLTVFCNAPDNTCSINNLCDLVWKRSIVEENTIQQAISRLNMKLKTLGLHIQYEFKDSYKLTFKVN